MSKISKLLNANVLTPDQQKRQLLYTTYITHEPCKPNFHYKIEMRACLSSSMTISPEFINSSRDEHRLSEIEKAIRMSLVEEVFGEFRKYIIKLQRQIYDIDPAGASETLRELKKVMFDYDGESRKDIVSLIVGKHG